MLKDPKITKISRHQFLKWSAISGITFIATIIRERVLSNPEVFPKEFSFEIVTVNDKGEIINQNQKTAQYLQKNLGNGVNIDFVNVPGGTFTMGSPDSERRRDDDEQPQRQITIPQFWMSKYPVTQLQYETIMVNNPSYFSGKNLPVERVSWFDAIKFCQITSQRLGKEIKLPSEAQWEYSCRAGTTTPFYFGPVITSDLANIDGEYSHYRYANEPNGIYREKTTDVGLFPPNAFGLYDMHGNIQEFCQDDYHDDLTKIPNDGSPWLDEGKVKVIRGGSWYDHPWYCRSAYRYVIPNNGSKNETVGFRVVMVI